MEIMKKMKCRNWKSRFAAHTKPVLGLIICCLSLTVCATAQQSPQSQPPPQPILRLETGMHAAVIRRIGVDRGGRFLVTASGDKTARVWEIASGKLLRVLRVPLDTRNDGELFSTAMSPDGNKIAVGGWTSKSGWDTNIYVFDRESGRLLRRLPNLPNVINHLVFSPDGKYLAAALGSRGVYVYETSGWTQVGSDSDYVQDSYGADFDQSGRRLVTGCYDGYLRLYSVSPGGITLLAKKAAGGGKKPISVKFSPDGGKIAVGFTGTTEVNVVSASDLSLLFAPDTTGAANGDLSSVAWSADGNTLYAGGRYDVKGDFPIRFWTGGGHGKPAETKASINTIMDILPLPGGGVIYGAFDPAWGVIDAGGRRNQFVTSTIPDYRGMQSDFLTSKDGAEIQFFYYDSKSLTRFSLNERRLDNADRTGKQSLNAPRTEGLNVTDWSSNYEPKLNGIKLNLGQYERSNSLAVAPDNSKFLLGTSFNLLMFDPTGKKLWELPAPGSTRSVNFSGDGRLATAAYGDGTIRWYRVSDGTELLAFFPHTDKKRWVLWTPTGYYDASSDAEELIGWHVNNGRDAAADFYPVGLFRTQFYRPDVVSKILYTTDETRALQIANDEAGRKQQLADVSKQLPPVVEILSPSDRAEVSSTTVRIGYHVRTPNGEPVTNIKVLVDGRPVTQERGAGNRPAGASEVTVTIPEKDSEVAIIAENRFAPSVPAIVRLKWRGMTPITETALTKPKLYILAVGISQYSISDFNLGLAAKDARDFVAVMQRQKGGLYRDVEVKILTDAEATRDNVVDGLDWITRQTTSKDVAMVFFAGHGINDNLNRYYFAPHNFNPERLASTGVTFTDIKNAVEAIAGKTIFFVDTCHSGNSIGTTVKRRDVDMNGFVNELASAENGAIVFNSATGKQVALEDSLWGNGAFTKALIEGLSGKAEVAGRGKITINSLDLFVSERVKQLTGGRQTPTTTKPNTVPDFPVAVRQ